MDGLDWGALIIASSHICIRFLIFTILEFNPIGERVSRGKKPLRCKDLSKGDREYSPRKENLVVRPVLFFLAGILKSQSQKHYASSIRVPMVLTVGFSGAELMPRMESPKQFSYISGCFSWMAHFMMDWICPYLGGQS